MEKRQAMVIIGTTLSLVLLAAFLGRVYRTNAQTATSSDNYLIEGTGLQPDGTEIIYVAPISTSTLADSLTTQNRAVLELVTDLVKSEQGNSTSYLYGRLDYIVQQLNTLQNTCAKR